MQSIQRFGRKIPLPSTRQIIHELRLLEAGDRIAALKAELAAIQSKAAADGSSMQPAAAVSPL